MTPQRLEVWLARLDIGDSHDLRPCIVLGEVPNGLLLVIALSANLDLYREGVDFWIEARHPNFHSTGLRRTSYVIRLGLARVEASELLKCWGRLEGEVASAFEKWLCS